MANGAVVFIFFSKSAVMLIGMAICAILERHVQFLGRLPIYHFCMALRALNQGMFTNKFERGQVMIKSLFGGVSPAGRCVARLACLINKFRAMGGSVARRAIGIGLCRKIDLLLFPGNADSGVAAFAFYRDMFAGKGKFRFRMVKLRYLLPGCNGMAGITRLRESFLMDIRVAGTAFLLKSQK